MKRIAIIALIYLCVLSISCQAGTIRRVAVDGTGNGSSWANAYGSIQDAINASSSGDEVWVIAYSDGTVFNESITLKDGVSVKGGYLGDDGDDDLRDISDDPTYITTISASGLNNCVVYADEITAATTIEYCTLRDGSGKEIVVGEVPDDYTTDNGGGVYCQNSSPIISHCRICNNSCSISGNGGGVYCQNSSPIISHCQICNNSCSANGGGIYCSGSSPTISYCIISNNNPTYYGGGIFADMNSAPNIEGCTIASNMSQAYGGGIYIYKGNCINNVIQENNASGSSGGGIFVGEYSSSTPVITGNTISSNHASPIAGYGGGVLLYYASSSIVLYNNDIDNNVACTGGGIDTMNSCSIDHCRVRNNNAEYYSGGGISAASDTIITNCIVSGNTTGCDPNYYLGRGGGISAASSCTISNCEISGNSTAYGNGGGINAGAGCTINNNKIINNHAAVSSTDPLNAGCGGGVYLNATGGTSYGLYCNVIKGNTSVGCTGGIYILSGSSPFTFNNNTIVGNTGGSCDRFPEVGAYISTSITASLYNNIFADNDGYGLWITHDYNSYNNCFNGNDTNYNRTPIISQNDIFSPPGFDTDGYHLVFGSACKNAGYDDAALANWTDVDNEPRKNGTVDIGADEYTPLTCTINQADPNDPTRTNPVNFTVIFSVPVIEFTDDDVIITDDNEAVVNGVTITKATGSDTTYNVAVNLTTVGRIHANIPAGVVQSKGGVWNSAATYDDNSVTYIGDVIYVKPGGTGDQSGLNWNNAKPTIQSGLDATDTYHQTQVWVAKGTYNERITLKTGVALYGGFAGTETQLSERPTFQRAQPDQNESTIDGNELGSVVTIPTGATTSTIIDGFTIKDGVGTLGESSNLFGGGGIYCSSGSPTISHNKIFRNYIRIRLIPYQVAGGGYTLRGGGIYIGGGSPIIEYNVISGNDAAYGGGIWLANATATVANNVISANGGTYGGGIYCNSGTTTIDNNTIVANNSWIGGAIYCNNSVSIIGNIIAYNGSTYRDIGSGIWQTNASQFPTIDYNCLYNGSNVNDTASNYYHVSLGQNNKIEEPQFARIDYNDLHIQPTSPCRNAGSNGVMQSLSTDIEGRTRILDTTVDMGAYESDGTTYSITDKIYRVIGTSGSDDNDGSDWDTSHAMATIQGAINKAAVTGGDVWVKGGSDSTPITFSEHITLSPFVYLYGGFTGNADQRGNYTTLDGENNGHVLTIWGGYYVNIVDGFTICRGLEMNDDGGGIMSSRSSPVISNNTLQNNTVGCTSNPYYMFGGGIYCVAGSPMIFGNIISSNTAQRGGGIAVSACNANISGNYIIGNGPTKDGGGIFSNGRNNITNNFIYGNSADIQGCGIFREGDGNITIANNTITHNTSTSGTSVWKGGGGVSLAATEYDIITLANNIIAYNRDGIYRNADYPWSLTLDQYKNCVYENRGIDNILRNYNNITSYGTNFSINPMMDASYPWRITTGSSCKNTADPSYATSYDIEGQQRDSTPDVGCYEYYEY